MFRQFCLTFFLDQLDTGIQIEQGDLLTHAHVHLPMLCQHQLALLQIVPQHQLTLLPILPQYQLTLLPILCQLHYQPTHLPSQATLQETTNTTNSSHRLVISNLNFRLNLPGNHIKTEDIKVQQISTKCFH